LPDADAKATKAAAPDQINVKKALVNQAPSSEPLLLRSHEFSTLISIPSKTSRFGPRDDPLIQISCCFREYRGAFRFA
jgi:hypothetical protein